MFANPGATKDKTRALQRTLTNAALSSRARFLPLARAISADDAEALASALATAPALKSEERLGYAGLDADGIKVHTTAAVRSADPASPPH